PELSGGPQTTEPFATVGTGRAHAPTAAVAAESNRNLYIAIGAGVLVVVAALLFFTGGGEPEADPAAVADAKAAADSAEGLPKNRALIKANVEAANVLLDGQFRCKTPCEIEVPVGDNRPHEIRLTKDGYIDVMQNWQPRTITDPLPPFPDLKPISPVVEVKGTKGKKPASPAPSKPASPAAPVEREVDPEVGGP
ncbi:MAG TPA: PEGA domain-containing protein, partial [Nannocystis sp.]